MASRYNYETILKMAGEYHGTTVKDLIALAPANDPFYCGRPGQVQAAEWFYNLWQDFGFHDNIHLRRVHYRAVSAAKDSPVQLPVTLSWTNKATKQKESTDTYLNNIRCWNYLVEAGKYARYLGLIPAEQFSDRRNPEALIEAAFVNPGHWDWDYYYNPTPKPAATTPWEFADDEERSQVALPTLPTIPGYLPDTPELELPYSAYTVQQPKLIELWCEKSTMNDILEPLARSHRINLVTGLGELSITAVMDFLNRTLDAQRPAHIIYISDYDPAGLGMPISVARKIEFYQRNDYRFEHLQISLEPVVLTAQMVEQYDLPRIPVKDEDPRKQNWERDHGQGQVELDALEALHPGQLKRILSEAILEHQDLTLRTRAQDERRLMESWLQDQAADVFEEYDWWHQDLTDQYYNLIQAYEVIRDEYQELTTPFQDQLERFNQQLLELTIQLQQHYDTIGQAMAERAAEIDPEADDFPHPVPEADLPEINRTMLFKTGRAYTEQLAEYKAYRHNGQ